MPNFTHFLQRLWDGLGRKQLATWWAPKWLTMLSAMLSVLDFPLSPIPVAAEPSILGRTGPAAFDFHPFVQPLPPVTKVMMKSQTVCNHCNHCAKWTLHPCIYHIDYISYANVYIYIHTYVIYIQYNTRQDKTIQYTYVYIYICVCVCICHYMYIIVHTHQLHSGWR